MTDVVNVGSAANAGNGDPLRSAFVKVNAKFDALEATALYNGVLYTNTGAWTTATAYAVNDLAIESSVVYVCQAAHTSGVFATDLAAGKWTVHQGATAAELAAAAGAGMLGYDPDEAYGAGTVGRALQRSVSPRDFGAAGDGTTDDSAAMALAIASGLNIDLGGLTYRIVTQLDFDQPNQIVRHGRLLFDGAETVRLANVTASGVLFTALRLDGNGKQVNGGLVYVADGAARFQMGGGSSVTNIAGTHIGGDVNRANHQYGLLISPYAVTSLGLYGVRFKDISNTNDGTNGVAATARGFAGGIMFIRGDLSEPTDAQPTPTSGIISGCRFDNIHTVLAGGLSTANSIDYQDADGVRCYGNASGADTLYVTVADSVFVDCAKRAVKGSTAKGVRVRNITVVATAALQYPMVTAVKADGTDFDLDGLVCYSPSASPLRYAVQTHTADNVSIRNVKVHNCEQLWDIAPFSSSDNPRGLTGEHIYADGVTAFGVRQSTLVASQIGWHFDDIEVRAASTAHGVPGFVVGNASTGLVEMTVRNLRLHNAEIKVGGTGYDIDDVAVTLDDASFAGSTASVGLVEIGNGFASGGRKSRLGRLTVEVIDCPAAYLNATRQRLVYLYSDDSSIDGITLSVPDALTTAYGHLHVEGDQLAVSNLDYFGAGVVYVGATTGASNGPFKGLSLNGARRLSALTGKATSFLFVSYLQNSSINNVLDTLDSSAQSIRTDNLTAEGGRTYALTVSNVASRTTNASVVTGTSIAAVSVSNAVKL